MHLDPTQKRTALICTLLSLIWGVVKFGGLYLLAGYIPWLETSFAKVLVSIISGLVPTVLFHWYLKRNHNTDVYHFTLTIIKTLMYWSRSTPPQ